MFQKVCIIGCGLIGSSIARAIKKYNLSNNIVSSNNKTVVVQVTRSVRHKLYKKIINTVLQELKIILLQKQ